MNEKFATMDEREATADAEPRSLDGLERDLPASESVVAATTPLLLGYPTQDQYFTDPIFDNRVTTVPMELEAGNRRAADHNGTADALTVQIIMPERDQRHDHITLERGSQES